MFATGAAGLVSEYLLSTISTYILGNSIEQFSVIIALMMLMMGVAGWAQKFLPSKNLIRVFILIEITLALLGGFAPLAIYGAFGFVTDHFTLVQYFFVTAIGFLIGFEIPVVLRINEQYSETLGINVSKILSADYIGSFVGALIWSFYLLKYFPLTEISFMMAGFNFTVALITYIYFMRHKLIKGRPWLLIPALLTAALLIVGYVNNRGWQLKLEQHLYEDPIVMAKTTKYQRLIMTHDNTLDEHRFYINGNLQFSSIDEQIYHELLVHPAMHLNSQHKEILILGGGDGMALREVLKYPDVNSVTLVDLDPDMVKICSSNPIVSKLNHNAFNDARIKVLSPSILKNQGLKELYQEGDYDDQQNRKMVKIADINVFHIDADLFIGAIKKQYDLIFIDFPDPNSIELTKLYSKEFYLKLRGRLKPGGLAAIQATSPYHAKASYLCIKRTIEAAGFHTIPYHENVPSFGDWGWFLFWRGDVTVDQKKNQIATLPNITVPVRYVTPDVIRRSLIFGKGQLHALADDINTLMYPVLMRLYLDESWLVD